MARVNVSLRDNSVTPPTPCVAACASSKPSHHQFYNSHLIIDFTTSFNVYDNG